jgi:hypothetical protein
MQKCTPESRQNKVSGRPRKLVKTLDYISRKEAAMVRNWKERA